MFTHLKLPPIGQDRCVMVTGTRRGATDRQLILLSQLLAVCATRHKFNVFRDGDCVGVDIQARAEAKQHGLRCIVHPSTAKTRAHNYLPPSKEHSAGMVIPPDELMIVRDPLVRNRDMVTRSHVVLGVPGEKGEVLRSGTWACLRFTGKVRRPTIIIYPDGELDIRKEGYLTGKGVNTDDRNT